MLIAVLGVIDLIAGLVLIFGAGISFPINILVILGLVLLAKSSLGLLKDFGSWIDLIAGLTILFSTIISIPVIISFVIGLLIIQKGAISFFYTPL